MDAKARVSANRSSLKNNNNSLQALFWDLRTWWCMSVNFNTAVPLDHYSSVSTTNITESNERNLITSERIVNTVQSSVTLNSYFSGYKDPHEFRFSIVRTVIITQSHYLVKSIIANVSQSFPYNLQQFPNVLQRYFLKAIFLMLQFWICSHNAKMFF